MKANSEQELHQSQQSQGALLKEPEQDFKSTTEEQIMKANSEQELYQSQQSQEVLLKEYELAQNAFYELEKNIWQTAGIFVALSLGGVSLLLTRNQHNWANLVIVAGIGLISILILWLWYRRIYYRWWSLEGVLLYRMREIESEIGMWTEQYVYYLDITRIAKQKYPLTNQKGKERFAKLDIETRHYATAPARAGMQALVGVLVSGWILLILHELMLTMPVTRIWLGLP